MLPLFNNKKRDVNGRLFIQFRPAGGIPTRYLRHGWAMTPSDNIPFMEWAPSEVPATALRSQGIAFTPDGAMYITADQVSRSSIRLNGGIAARVDGAIHVAPTLTAISTKIQGQALGVNGELLISDDVIVGLGNLSGWWRYGFGITTATGVSQWSDQSGSGKHLVQATGSAQPALQTDNSILWDGTNHWMQASFTLNQPFTRYALFKQVTWTAGDQLFNGVTATTLIAQNPTTPSLRLNAGSGAADNSNLAVDSYGAVAWIFNGASSLIQVNTTTPTTGDAGANNAGGLTIGNSGSPTLGGNIQVKEIIQYSVAHDAATRATVISYLSRVGGLNL